MSVIRTNLKSTCALAAVFGLILLAGSGGAQDQPPKVPMPQALDLDEAKVLKELMASRAQPELPSLETMLLSAMENNPAILVAKSKLREAEAELNRTRLQVARQAITLRFTIQRQREKVAILQDGVRREQMTTERLSEALVELSTLEAELQYILGQSLPDAGAAK